MDGFSGTSESFEQFRPYLSLLARMHLHSQKLAKLDSSDVVQQTLLNAFASRDQFRGSTQGELVAWLRTILKNHLADAVRSVQRDKRDVRLEQPLEAAIDDSFCRTHDWLAAAQSSPSERVVRQEQLLQLAAAIEQLPDNQRDVVVLHHLEGCTLAETAERLNCSEPAAAGLLHRGLKRLRELMDG